MALPFDTSLGGKRIFLRVGPTDFRRGVRGMVSLVVGAMNMRMDEQSMFVFCSTSKKQIRIVSDGWKKRASANRSSSGSAGRSRCRCSRSSPPGSGAATTSTDRTISSWRA